MFLLNYVKQEKVKAQVRHQGYVVKGDRVIGSAVKYLVKFPTNYTFLIEPSPRIILDLWEEGGLVSYTMSAFRVM